MQGRVISTALLPLLTGRSYPAIGCCPELHIWCFWNTLLPWSCISPFLMHNLDFSLLQITCLRNCWCFWEKNPIIKLYKVFFVDSVLDIYTFILLWVFPIFVSGMNTEPLLFGNSPIPMRSHEFLLHIICIMKLQFLVVPWWMDGWTDGLWVEEKLEVAFCLMEQLLHWRKGRPSKTQGETWLLKSWGDLSS